MGFVCHFWATIISNGLPCATAPLPCLSVTLAFIVAKQLDGLRCYWYGSWPRPRRHCVRWGPSCPPRKRDTAASHFSAHVYCGQMFTHLSNS